MSEEEKTVIGKTPEDQTVIETPTYSAPGIQHNYLGVYGEWLGDPDRRYGRLETSRNIPAHTKMEMLGDPVIALCQGYVGATLVRAERVIECADEPKRLFFEAMFREWEQEFILQASMAVALGSCGLIKRFVFRRPEPVELGADPVWEATADPFIIEGFDQVYPVGSSARFDNKGKRFEGMTTPDGKIDRFYTLWLTIGKAWAFGSYRGWGRLRACYRDWWMKHFARDQYVIWLQKNIDRITVVRYPSGKTRAGQSFREIALATGDAARAGSTVALPSEVYHTMEGMTATERLSSVRKWTMDFIEGVSKAGDFNTVDDHHDSKMALAYFVPPQMFMYVRQSALGGPTTADVLSDLAENLLLLEATDVDTHVNLYVFPAISRANFAPDSPPVRVRTIGLEPSARSEIYEIASMLLAKVGTDTSMFDLRGAMERLNMPMTPEVEVDPDDLDPDDLDPDDDGEPDADLSRVTAQADDDSPPREVLEEIVQAEILPVKARDGTISDNDIRRAYRKLKSALPELFEEGEDGET